MRVTSSGRIVVGAALVFAVLVPGNILAPVAHGATSAHSTLVVDQANSPATLDPGQQYDTDSYVVYRNIFDQLLERAPKTLKIVPWVAQSWKLKNSTTWVFIIRKNIKFTNGARLTAADVAFSLDRILDPAYHSPQFANFSVVKSATASGNTVTIKTNSPSPTLLSFLTTLSIVPKAYVQSVGNAGFNLRPVGSGPYKLVSFQSGGEVHLDANNHYWHGKPPFSHVVFRDVPSDASRVADLQSGKADIALGLTPDDTQIISSASSLKVLATPTERVAYVAFNALGNFPTKDVRVREAIAYSINYQSIITNILRGYGKPVKEVLTPFSFGYDPHVAGFSYNPAKAKALLAASGDPHPSMTFITSPSYSQVIVQALQSDMNQVGMNVSIENTDQATYLKKIQNPDHNWGSVRYGRWSCSCLDADGTIYPLFRTGTIWSSYSNRRFDALVDRARTTTNKATRKKDYTGAFKILQRDVPAVALYQDYAIYGASKHLRFKPDPQESFFLIRMGWSK